MIHQFVGIWRAWPWAILPHVRLYDRVCFRLRSEYGTHKRLNVVSGAKAAQVLQPYSTILEARMNMLFDPTGNEEAKGKRRVLFEEFDNAGDEFLDAFLVFALVEAVNHDEIRME